MVYHQTKDVLSDATARTQKYRQHTLLYVQLEEAVFDGECEYISKIAKSEQEICSLIEAGFEYITEFNGAKIFKKRE